MYHNKKYDIIKMLQNPKGDVIMKTAIIIIVAIIGIVLLTLLLMPLFEWVADLIGLGLGWIFIIFIVMLASSMGY